MCQAPDILPCSRRSDRRYNMHSFHYRHGHLYCEDVDLTRIAKEFGTPTYVYSAETILDHYRRLDAALAPLDHLICYAVKANSNRAILNLLVRAGAGFDIVSGGELYRVIKAGGKIAREIFSFPGGRRFEYIDPAGNRLGVWSDK